MSVYSPFIPRPLLSGPLSRLSIDERCRVFCRGWIVVTYLFFFLGHLFSSLCHCHNGEQYQYLSPMRSLYT